jgi:hypothetical protein
VLLQAFAGQLSGDSFVVEPVADTIRRLRQGAAGITAFESKPFLQAIAEGFGGDFRSLVAKPPGMSNAGVNEERKKACVNDSSFAPWCA